MTFPYPRRFPHRARGGRIAGAKKGMNKLEAAYARHLDAMVAGGEILWYKYEGVTLKLADDTRLTCDFIVQLADGEVVLRDTKAFNKKRRKAIIEDDAAVKLRVAATHFPFRVEKVTCQDGAWVLEEVCPE